MPLPCIRNSTAPRCRAKSKRTGLPCQNPAAFGCKTCRMHGAHKSRQAPSDENHWNYQHGKATKKRRAEDAASATRLLLLRDLGVKLGMFGDQPTGWPGRKPRGYPPTEAMSFEELMVLIEQIERLPAS